MIGSNFSLLPHRDIHNQLGTFRGLSAAMKTWLVSTAPGQGILRVEALTAWVTLLFNASLHYTYAQRSIALSVCIKALYSKEKGYLSVYSSGLIQWLQSVEVYTCAKQAKLPGLIPLEVVSAKSSSVKKKKNLPNQICEASSLQQIYP